MTVNPSAGAGLAACSEAQYAEEGEQYVPRPRLPERLEARDREDHRRRRSLKKRRARCSSPNPRRFGEAGHNPFEVAARAVSRRADPRPWRAGQEPPGRSANQSHGPADDDVRRSPAAAVQPRDVRVQPGRERSVGDPADVRGLHRHRRQLTPWSNPDGPPLQPLIPPFPITSELPVGRYPAVQPPGDGGHAKTTMPAPTARCHLDRRAGRRTGDHGFLVAAAAGVDGEPDGRPVVPGSGGGSWRVLRGRRRKRARRVRREAKSAIRSPKPGVGPVLAQAPGKIYLGGPFQGAPFSVVSITSAHVGPFDLGTVVVHFPLDINPETAQVSVPAGPGGSDPAHHQRHRDPRARRSGHTSTGKSSC